MFGTTTNPFKAYETVSLETAVNTASPHQLVVLLFEGAHQAIVNARVAMENKDIPRKGTSISSAIDIILNGLKASINLEEGGELAANLSALYEYMGRRLLYANLQNDAGALNEVDKLLREIHSAWIEIGDPTRNPQSAGAT